MKIMMHPIVRAITVAIATQVTLLKLGISNIYKNKAFKMTFKMFNKAETINPCKTKALLFRNEESVKKIDCKNRHPPLICRYILVSSKNSLLTFNILRIGSANANKMKPNRKLKNKLKKKASE